MKRTLKRLWLAAGSGLLAGIAFLGWLAWQSSVAVPLELNAAGRANFEIPAGIGLKTAARVMAESGIGIAPWRFVLLGRLTGHDRNIQAGSYEVGPGVTTWQLLEKLTAGDVTQAALVVVEGKTFRELRTRIDASPDLRHDTAGLTDTEILQRIGAVETYPEGLFFPDTYLFARQSSDLALYRRAYEAMQRRLTLAWERRDPAAAPYRSPYEALVMASIVEKETGLAADRGKVASVFVNRLKRGMRLQTDPSVIYGLGDKFDGNLRKRDLEADTPWNTYTRAGLPPTPIALPGQDSLDAALNPPSTPYLYFVAQSDGSGASVFSTTLEAHNRAVNRYQRGGK